MSHLNFTLDIFKVAFNSVIFIWVLFLRSLDKAVSSLELELAVARASKDGGLGLKNSKSAPQKAFAVIGINTAFSSRKRRDSLRETWVPTG